MIPLAPTPLRAELARRYTFHLNRLGPIMNKRESLLKSGSEQVLYQHAESALSELRALVKLGGNSNSEITRLIQHVLHRSGRLVLYLGAGCSKTVHPPGQLGRTRAPSWDALIADLVKGATGAGYKKFLEDLLRRSEVAVPSNAVESDLWKQHILIER